MNWFVYILKCKDESLYCGITNDLKKRIKIHNSGKASKYTRSRLPVFVVYSEEVNSKSDALKREIQIKRMSRLAKLSLIGK